MPYEQTNWQRSKCSERAEEKEKLTLSLLSCGVWFTNALFPTLAFRACQSRARFPCLSVLALVSRAYFSPLHGQHTNMQLSEITEWLQSESEGFRYLYKRSDSSPLTPSPLKAFVSQPQVLDYSC